MGKKKKSEGAGSRKINVEIAPGNQADLDRYIQEYNHSPDRTTPKVKYTDVVNEALDQFLTDRGTQKKARGKPAGKK